ncbi:MAG: GTP-binding protein [Algicola sp.]|nr:GTP-binding protein [Algicola sp.]
MSNVNEIILRPRFKLIIHQENDRLLKLFEAADKEQSAFIVSRIDDHVFIKIPKEKQHFWSPQLHLEINKNDQEETSTIYGLFGPNPTVWTMFMFLHFMVAGLFIGFGIWTYVNWRLGSHYAIPLFLTLLMILLWFALYFGGRLGKKTGAEEMQRLHDFMKETLNGQDIQSKR